MSLVGITQVRLLCHCVNRIFILFWVAEDKLTGKTAPNGEVATEELGERKENVGRNIL